MSPAPGPNYAWVAGHYRLVNGQWQWVNGRWAVPPTNGAVWVPGGYDPDTHQWSEGRWQPTGAGSANANR